MNNFGRGPPKDHLCEIISKLDVGFRRICHLSQLLTDGRRTKTDHKSSPCHYVTGEIKTVREVALTRVTVDGLTINRMDTHDDVTCAKAVAEIMDDPIIVVSISIA